MQPTSQLMHDLTAASVSVESCHWSDLHSHGRHAGCTTERGISLWICLVRGNGAQMPNITQDFSYRAPHLTFPEQSTSQFSGYSLVLIVRSSLLESASPPTIWLAKCLGRSSSASSTGPDMASSSATSTADTSNLSDWHCGSKVLLGQAMRSTK